MRQSAILAAAALTIGLALPIDVHADGAKVKGEVTRINIESGKITIKHEPIKKYDMDAMTMVFRAGDPVMLTQVKPGDKIRFHAEKVNGQFTVTKIEKAKK